LGVATSILSKISILSSGPAIPRGEATRAGSASCPYTVGNARIMKALVSYDSDEILGFTGSAV
jgi:hypothetical protein